MRPDSSMSMLLAAGTLGRPGMVMMSPVCTTMNPAPADMDHKACGSPEQLRVVREGVLGLGHADGQISLAQGGDVLDGLFGGGGVLDPVGSVDLPCDGLDLGLDGLVQFIERVEVRGLLAGGDDLFRQVDRTLASLGEVLAEGEGHAESLHLPGEDGDLRIGVGGEAVDGHHHRHTELFHVFDVLFQVGQALFQGGGVLRRELRLGHAAVVLQRPDGSHQHHRRRGQTGHAALDVHEFLGAEVRTEARLGDAVVSQLEGQLGGPHRVAAVGDVGKGAAVHQRRGILQRLHQVGLDGVLEQGGHRPFSGQVPAVHRLTGIGVGHQDLPQAAFEIPQVRRQAEDRHDLAGHSDLEAVFSGGAVRLAAETDDRVAQRPVVHVQTALEEDTPGVDAQSVALLDVVVDQSTEQVVGGGDGVHVSGEVQVDVLHRHHLGVAAAGGAALDAEHRPEGRLPQCDDRLLPDAGHGLAEADGGGGLALTGGSGVDGGDQDQLAVGGICQAGEDLLGEFGLVPAIGFQLVGADAKPGGDFGDREHRCLGGDLDIG